MENKGLLMSAIVIILLGIWLVDFQDYKVLKKKGAILYPIKGQGKQLYLIGAVELVVVGLFVWDYIKYRRGEMLVNIGCITVVILILVVRAIRKFGFYENALVLGTGCYELSQIKSYYWSKYVLQSQTEPLMLEVTKWRMFKSNQTTLTEIAVPKEDMKKIEMILQGYGIEKKKSGNNTSNVK